MKYCILILALFTSSTFAMAPRSKLDAKIPDDQLVNNKEELRFAQEYFDGKLVLPQPAYPLRGAGALAWVDTDTPAKISYTRLLPDKKLPEPEAISEVLFESIIDKKVAASASYLAFISAEMSDADKAVVSMKKTLRAIGPEYLTIEVQEAIARVFPLLAKKPGRRFYYLETIQLISTSSSVLRVTEGKVSGAFFVTLGGSTYASASRSASNQFAVAEYVYLGETGIADPLSFKSTKDSEKLLSAWGVGSPNDNVPTAPHPVTFNDAVEIQ